MPKYFVVILHAFRATPKKYDSLKAFVKKELGEGTHVHVPPLPLQPFSFTTPQKIVDHLKDEITAYYEKLSPAEQSATEIILVGHSTGAILLRKLYADVFGRTNDGIPWASKVKRLILLAGINHGWSLNRNAGWRTKAVWLAGICIAKVLSVFGLVPVAMHTKRGAAFMERLNTQLSDLNEHHPEFVDQAISVQLLGRNDSLVIAEDTVDDKTSPGLIYLEVNDSDHSNVVQMGLDGDLTEEEEGRRQVMRMALRGSRESLQNKQPRNLSLRAVEILREEFKYFNGPDSLDDLKKVKALSASEDELSFSDDAGQWKDFLNRVKGAEPVSTSLEQSKIDNKLLPEEEVQKLHLSYSTQKQEVDLTPESVRLGRLNKWLQTVEREESDTQETMVRNALNKRLKDKMFIFKERWIEDASLRPYTRSLMAKYAENRPGAKSEAFWLDQFRVTSADMVRYAYAYRILNRMILEDIYPEIILQRDDVETEAIQEEMLSKNTTAVCLSGGGIRSGTFGLGILQGLAQKKDGGDLLSKVDYLSTVSGGGYIGGWLSAWIHQSRTSVPEELNTLNESTTEPGPIRHLRQYSNYLTPQVGLFSADTWTLFAIYLRNLFLNWLILLPLLAAITLIPWIVASIVHLEPHFAVPGMLVFVGAILLIASDAYTKKYPPMLQRVKSSSVAGKLRTKKSQESFLRKCLFPGSIAMIFWVLAWYWFRTSAKDDLPAQLAVFQEFFTAYDAPGLCTYICSILGVMAFVTVEWIYFFAREKTDKFLREKADRFLRVKVYNFLRDRVDQYFTRKPSEYLHRNASKFLRETTDRFPERFTDGVKKGKRYRELLSLLGAAVVAGALLVLLDSHFPYDMLATDRTTLYTWLALPGFMLIVLLIGFLGEGLRSSFLEDSEREWSARYSGWFLIVALGWLFVCGLVLYVPLYTEQKLGHVFSLTALSGYLTAYLGNRLKKSADGGGSGKIADKLNVVSQLGLTLIAFIAFVLLLILFSDINMFLIGKLHDTDHPTVAMMIETNPLILIGFAFGLTIISFVCSRTIDSNRFSLHSMYRSRLIRGYLGASRPNNTRRPDPFTGFDESDNIYMGTLATKPDASKAAAPDADAATQAKKSPVRPFHVVGIALNLVAGSNLAWQERKATSFTVSPLHAGSLNLGYRRTYIEASQNGAFPEKNSQYYGGDRGISLGTAMTISGAAVSPNWGYHSSTLVAFFMTLFNLRLGAWLGNPSPAGDRSFNNSSPKALVNPIFKEMLGLTNDESEYVYLSDGGHFENLGLYEMVLRRNRFIIVSDASCDETCNLEDLGNAIRKIRIDLGVEIDFPHEFNIGPRADKPIPEGRYWALGRIRYPRPGQKELTETKTGPEFNAHDGVLLYIKPGIYNSEPKDIYNYASANKAFPHESTSDQFFSESQFESYRALGLHAMRQVRTGIVKRYGIELATFMKPTNWQTDVIDKLNKARKTEGVTGNRLWKFTYTRSRP